MPHTHEPISQFLQQQTITVLPGDITPFPDQQYMKAGVVPYIRNGREFLYLLVKPRTRDTFNPPAFQLCKGTRMYLHRGSGWRDMKPGDEETVGKETLITTALREGIEELGLKLEAITQLHDVGPYKFTSEKTGKNKYMWLFTAELTSMEALLPLAEIEQSTAERVWQSAAQFDIDGREDHRYILRDIDSKLQIYYRG